MRLLDLFCGAGGAAMGYHQAGFTEIVGVDINPQPNYPFDFIQHDVLDMAGFDWARYDLIHASPPCQRWSRITPDRSIHPDLIAPTRALLGALGVPYVMENVPGSPLVGYLRLCGSMFGMQIQRHRYFELSFPVMSLACNHKEWENGRPHTVAGHVDGPNGMWSDHHYGVRDVAHAKNLMGMPWVSRIEEAAEAIPPAYTRFIGEQFLAQHARYKGMV